MSSKEDVMSRHLPIMVEEYSSLVQMATKKGAAGGDTAVKLQPAVRMVTFTVATKAFLGDLLTRQELEQLFPEVCKFGAGALSLVRLQKTVSIRGILYCATCMDGSRCRGAETIRARPA